MNKNTVHETKLFWFMHGHPGHTIAVPKDGRWQFNGDFVKPTFTPSVNEMDANGHHFFVTDGIVHYLSDKKGTCCAGQDEYYPIPVWSENP